MPVEFPGMGAADDGSATTLRSGVSFDRDTLFAETRAHQDSGWDRLLTACAAGSPAAAPFDVEGEHHRLGRAGFPAVRWTGADDPLAAPVLDDLRDTYVAPYGPGAHQELGRYAATEFRAPDGGFLLLLEGGAAVAAGAFRRRDASTAEVKRMWTRADRRRQGLARRVLAELEVEAHRRGYTGVYLTTGSSQQDAAALYLAAGYTPHFPRELLLSPPATFRELPFTKPLRPPTPSPEPA